MTDREDRVETNELIRTDSSSGQTYMFCRREKRFLNLLNIIYVIIRDALSNSETFCTSVSEINQFMYTQKHMLIVIYRYLYGVIENQRIKLSQVLDMVALNYMVVLFH